ncbi:peptidoglycan-associated lipoprotein Pal [Rhizomicrobium electricum]|jgi:peptidoglycan-associated lipoprotein|uniref:Peptidoglycan-associated lipoprotein n=1 Tax=Rhizomicrobium electricum TaxID=480070 RepID=A0ABN1EW74_9PROT|nr:peptidoglycan-associated lipoprotein Pal [Rhizomicrobium electricum]NIJ50031.1 peptidoglycan-associated lipoprotein [Rhizomicrobium electricum]
MKNFVVGPMAVVALSLFVAGCATKAPPPPPPPPAVQPAPPPAPSIVPGSAQDLKVNVGDTVHFEYDKYAVLEQDKATLQRQAAWLAKWPNIKVTVEGHADERGTREYNIALGAKRANAVKEYLVSLGVSAARVDTVSYGKERPVCTDSTEDCWSQNRRGVTIIASGANS